MLPHATVRYAAIHYFALPALLRADAMLMMLAFADYCRDAAAMPLMMLYYASAHFDAPMRRDFTAAIAAASLMLSSAIFIAAIAMPPLTLITLFALPEPRH